MSVQSQIHRLQQAVADAYSAVDSKGGTLPQDLVSGNLAEAIRSIQSGYKRVEGTFTTDNVYGAVTVSLGFQPDFVYFPDFYYHYSSTVLATGCATAFFREVPEDWMIEINAYDINSKQYYLYPKKTDDGFGLKTTYVKEDWNDGQGKAWHYAMNRTFHYVAVKYT